MVEAWKDIFHSAVAQKNADMMRQAISAGLPINEYVLSPWGEGGGEFTPLLYAVDKKGGESVVAVLIAVGADVNARAIENGEQKATPLMLAALRGQAATAKQLLAAGAAIDFAFGLVNSTALSYSTREKTPAHEAVMRTLLEAGAKPHFQALVSAAETGSPAMIDMLADAGADVNEVSLWGTALVRAADRKRADTTAALLRRGADPHLRVPAGNRNHAGQTALDAARKAKASKVIPILEAALADKRAPG
jgi:ankyrin repeat protein